MHRGLLPAWPSTQGFAVYKELLYTVHLTSLWSGRWHSPFSNKGKEAQSGEGAEVRFNPRETPLFPVQESSHSAVKWEREVAETLGSTFKYLPSETVENLSNCQRGSYNCSHFTDVEPWIREGTWPAQGYTLEQEKAQDLEPELSEFHSSSLCPLLPQV